MTSRRLPCIAFGPLQVGERHWYDKNKHIFPASRWEVRRRVVGLRTRPGSLPVGHGGLGHACWSPKPVRPHVCFPQTYDPEKNYGEYTIYGGGKE